MATPNQSNDVLEFERRSRTWEQSLLQPLVFDRVHRIVLDCAAGQMGGTAPGAILDVGCGTGRLLRRAGMRWPQARLIGVDPAEGMVAIARRLTPVATFEVGPAEALPLADASVDLALSTMSFHHWQSHTAGLQEVARVLRPGGHFVLADTRLPRPVARVIHHFGANDPAYVRDVFTQAGLKVLLQRRVFVLWLLVTAGHKKLG
jgi:ubiquinone/menaquinone biosynthesis C-methylase UbiE